MVQAAQGTRLFPSQECVRGRVRLPATPCAVAPPGSCVPAILQARVLQWVATPSSRASSRPRNRTQVSCIAHAFFLSFFFFFFLETVYFPFWCTSFLYHRATEGPIGAHPRPPQKKLDLVPTQQFSQEHPLPGNLDSAGQQSIIGPEGGMESPACQTPLVIKLGTRRPPPTVSVHGLFLLN